MISDLTSLTFVELVLFFSTAVLLIGLLVSYCFKDHSARAHQVLLTAMLGAVCVPCIHRSITFFDWGVLSNAEWVPLVQIAEPDSVQPAALVPDLSTELAGSSVALSGDSVQRHEVPTVPWTAYVLSLWLVVSFLLLIRLAIAMRRTATLLREAEPLVDNSIDAALSAACQRLNVKGPIQVLTHGAVETPSIWCWQDAPVLLMPKTLIFSGGVDWTGIVCHELAHYRRRDHICDLTAEILLSLLPWHPLMWWAKRRLARLSEQACDDWVLSCGREGTEYAEGLLSFQTHRQQALFAPGIATSSKGLARRVHRILANRQGNPRIGRRWSFCVGGLAVFLAVGLSLAQEGVLPPSPVATPVDTERLVRLGATAPEEMTIERLAGIIEAMESAYVNIHVSYEWWAEPTQTLDDVGPGMGVTIGRPRHELLVSRPFHQKMRHYRRGTSVHHMNSGSFDTTTQSLFNGSVSKRLSITERDSSTPNADATIRRGRHFMPPVNSTPLRFSVLIFSLSDLWGNTPLSTFLTERKDHVRLTKEVSRINGFDCIHIELINPHFNVAFARLYLSVDHGYTPVRYEYLNRRESRVSYYADVNAFEEVLKGLWFPNSGTVHMREGLTNQYRALSPIVVNQRLSEEDFDVSFVPGTEVDDEVMGKDYLVQPTQAQQEKFDRNQRALRENADEIEKAKEPGGRLHSAGMLRKIGMASGLYFEDNDRTLPETLDDLRGYLSSEVLDWVKDNVILLPLDHLDDSAARAKAPLAYDETLLKQGKGTSVLYGSGMVEFLGQSRFDALSVEANNN